MDHDGLRLSRRAGRGKGRTLGSPGGSGSLGRVLGVLASEADNTLWVCVDDVDPKGNGAELKAFDLKSTAAKGS